VLEARLIATHHGLGDHKLPTHSYQTLKTYGFITGGTAPKGSPKQLPFSPLSVTRDTRPFLSLHGAYAEAPIIYMQFHSGYTEPAYSVGRRLRGAYTVLRGLP
jgi:hypothetical protein